MMPGDPGPNEYPVDDDARDWPIHHLVSDEMNIPEQDMQLAFAQATIWLHQAARGEVPHG